MISCNPETDPPSGLASEVSERACPICRAAMRHVFDKVILRKYDGQYDFCDECGFLRVRKPHWLAEAYTAAIAAADTGIMARNLAIANKLSVICDRVLRSRGPYLDFGAGHGILVRLMRDRGFDFRWSDEHAENHYARGFEYGPRDDDCTAVTAIELLEHVVDPLAVIRAALAACRSRTFIFTTELFTGDPPADWWYYAATEGQHIAFFRRDTLERMGHELGLRLVSENGVHVFSDRNISPSGLRAATSRIGRLLGKLRDRRRASLMMSDHVRISNELDRARG